MKKVVRSFRLPVLSSGAKDRAPELKVLFAADTHFQNVVNYKTYRLLERSQTYNGKIAASMGECAKHM